MAHDSEYNRIWDPEGTVNGLTVAEIANCLSVASGDIGTLCKANSINKWAKYKPFRLASLGIPTDAQRSTANYGLGNVPYYTNPTNMASDVLNGSMQNASGGVDYPQGDPYQYLAPQGGVSGSGAQPYRLLDFSAVNTSGVSPKGYNRLAACQVNAIPTSEASIVYYGSKVYFSFRVYDDPQEESVKLSDLTVPNQSGISLGNYYVGMAICRNGSVIRYIPMLLDGSGQAKVSDLGVNMANFSSSYANFSGAYKVFVFLSENTFSEGTSISGSGQKYFPLYFTLSDVTVASPSVKATIVFASWWNGTGNNRQLLCSCSIINNDNSLITFVNMTFNAVDSTGRVLMGCTSPFSPNTNIQYGGTLATSGPVQIVPQQSAPSLYNNGASGVSGYISLNKGGLSANIPFSSPIYLNPPR